MNEIRQRILREQEVRKARLSAHFSKAFSLNGTINDKDWDVETTATKSAKDVSGKNKRQTSLIKAIDIDGVDEAIDILKSAGMVNSDIEKAHQDGDMHPNGKWVWVASAAGGKGDWRTYGGRAHSKAGAAAASGAAITKTPKAKSTSTNSSKSDKADWGNLTVTQLNDGGLYTAVDPKRRIITIGSKQYRVDWDNENLLHYSSGVKVKSTDPAVERFKKLLSENKSAQSSGNSGTQTTAASKTTTKKTSNNFDPKGSTVLGSANRINFVRQLPEDLRKKLSSLPIIKIDDNGLQPGDIRNSAAKTTEQQNNLRELVDAGVLVAVKNNGRISGYTLNKNYDFNKKSTKQKKLRPVGTGTNGPERRRNKTSEPTIKQNNKGQFGSVIVNVDGNEYEFVARAMTDSMGRQTGREMLVINNKGDVIHTETLNSSRRDKYPDFSEKNNGITIKRVIEKIRKK